VEFIKVCPVAEIPAEGVIAVKVEDVTVAVARSGDRVYAVSDLCSHAEVSLSEGEVYDGTIECWLHGSCFDLRTGEPTNPPATRPIGTYQVQIRDGDVYIAPGRGARQ
jgi:3-phenylpropionate/trans-cinnamate dioxygenase ferredoxin subunit